MIYTILYVDWNADRHGKGIVYDVSEFSAFCLDNELHRQESFRFIEEKQNGYVASERHFDDDSKIIISNITEGWSAFREWIEDDSILIVWDKNTRTAINYMNKQVYEKANKVKNTYIYLDHLYSSMTVSCVREDAFNLMDTMNEMDLTCEANQMHFPEYRAECMVRLFRKLYTAGRKEMCREYVKSLSEADYNSISLHTFFPKLDHAANRERNIQYKKIFENEGMQARIVGNVVHVTTEFAKWSFHIETTTGEIVYYTNRYFQGMRHMTAKIEAGMEKKEKMKIICAKILEKDRVLSHGVGDDIVQNLLDKLCS